MLHPHLANLPCATCKAFITKDGRIDRNSKGDPKPRPPGVPTPCWDCPKISPASSAGLELDMPRIEQTLQLYWQVKAAGLPPAWRDDPILRQHLGIIERLVQQADRIKLRDSLAGSLTQILVGRI